MIHYVKWIDEIRLNDNLLVGQKCAILGELYSFKIPVPICFCVTSESYKCFIETSKLRPIIENLLSNTNLNSSTDLELTSNKIKSFILKQEIPERITKEILGAYEELCRKCVIDNIPVSIRSSGSSEDQLNDSFAGQYATFLNIMGKEEVIYKIKECWASIYSRQSLYYLSKKGYKHGNLFMAVIIQQMIPAEVSGVMFTVSPSGVDTEMILNSNWGLCEPLVGGRIISDYYVISKESSDIIAQHVQQKEQMVICNSKGGIETVNVPFEKRNRSSLTIKKIRVLSDLGKKIEKHFKKPLDIEWIFLNGSIMILQSRPITTLYHVRPLPQFPIEWEKETDKEIIWTRGMGVPARFVDPVTPLSFELVKAILANCWERAMKKLPLPYKVGKVEFRLFNSYLYWNIDLNEKPKFSFRFLYFIIKLWNALRTGIDSWKEYIPTYMTKFKNLKNFDNKDASINELHIHFKNICNLFSNYFVWEVYLGETIDIFFDIYLDVIAKLTKESKVQVAKLVQGVDNRTQEMNRNLWNLVFEANNNSNIRGIILNRLSFDETIKKIKECQDSEDFVRCFQDFLENYGHRSPKPDWFFSSWKEDPSYIMNNLRERLKRKDNDFENIFKKQVEERELLTNKLFTKIRSNLLKRIIFRWFIKKARQWAPLREDRQHYVKFASQLMKDTLKELNTRLIEKKIIIEQKDIFFLKLDEISDIIKNINSHERTKIKDLILKRKNEWQNAAELVPPPSISNQKIDDFLITKGKKLFGMPCSPGRVMGKARVLSNPSDFDKIEYGEILVVPETGPEWIFLFDLIKGIITNYGMPLSHSALLAREFGIPAVSGTKIGTGVIKTGQIVIVDGDSGVVILV